MKQDEEIIIVGGGLSGLMLASLLLEKNIKATILEASPRIGGRMQTLQGKNNTPLELGATWLQGVHTHIISTLKALGIQKFQQFSEGKSLFQPNPYSPIQEFFVPQNEASSYRIEGGSENLIHTLKSKLKSEQVILNAKVNAIREDGHKLIVETVTNETYQANKVVLCLPPQLVGSQISFSPSLPQELTALFPTVQTWMGGSIKYVIEYKRPFWRENGFSGMFYSNSGIIAEMYDHTNIDKTKFGFTGFLNPGAKAYTQEERKKFVLQQLEEILGQKATQPLLYEDKIWTDEFILDGNPVLEYPHQNNGHLLLQHQYMNRKLFFGGTEVSPIYSGYMEGAIIAAKNCFEKLVDSK
ncbi:flavin monoamine oxidase family protein [Flammeovirga agarivorans]|uniref:FAD-dependent oxidoreductase n=1 Tax=Flammeovirga agarivorans TaxID=2726742 RepID=A0A7X8SK70_9BACT|nr:NAD(P)/FAD-dependent oxidoreductase [Flammeovirga agarivorans]NLR91739.1 FAD-dependent oxidoreductase [Flammeovirga agarivorans]